MRDGSAHVLRCLKVWYDLPSDVFHTALANIELPLEAGGMTTLGITLWSRALPYFIEESANYKDLMRRLWQAKPCSQTSPCALLLYADEAVPGNVLNLQCFKKPSISTVQFDSIPYARHNDLVLI